MTKTIKLVLIVSLLLNVGLVVGFVVCINYEEAKFRGWMIHSAQYETKTFEGILSDLESGDNDPAKITTLKERLRTRIEIARGATEALQRVAEKSCK
jgi:hypothetical protein